MAAAGVGLAAVCVPPPAAAKAGDCSDDAGDDASAPLSRAASGAGSTPRAFLNFFKTMFGAGVLAFPHAFAWAGLIAGAVVYVAAVYLCSYSMLLLIRCKRLALARDPDAPVATYAGLAGHVGGRRGYRCVAFAVCFLELAFCTGWVIVAADNLHIVTGWATRAAFCGLAAPPLCLLCCVRWMADLWPLSFAGVVVYLGGVMGVTYYYIASGRISAELDDVHAVRWGTLPRFAGTAMYGLEAILMALPVEGSMARPRDAPVVIAGGTVLYAALAAAFGAAGYVYGLGSCDTDGGAVVTDCLPSGALTTAVRVSLASALLISYPVILYPVSEIAEEILFQAPPPPARRCAVRCVEVLLTCAVASAFPDFSVFSGVVGTMIIPMVGFVLPPLIHLKLVPWAEMPACERCHDVIMLLCGPVLLILGVASLIAG